MNTSGRALDPGITILKNRWLKLYSLYLKLLVILLVLLPAGCARVPQPASYPFSRQKKMQSVYHWDVLAQDIAGQVMAVVEAKLVDSEKTCIVVNPDSTVFGQAFAQLLNAHLLKDLDGLPVSEQGFFSLSAIPNPACIQVQYEAQVIKHRTDRSARVYPGTWTVLTGAIAVMHDFAWYEALLGTGVLADLTGGIQEAMSHNEVLITTKIVRKNMLVSLWTNMYYINDRDDWHYREEEKLPLKQFNLVTDDNLSKVNLL